jgi:hypothetical protein
MQLVTVLVLCGCLAVGMGLGLLASLKLDATRRPEQLPYPVNTLLLGLNSALVGVVLLAALPVDYFGLQTAVIAGAAILGLSFFGLIAVPPPRAVPLVVAAGFGLAMLYLALIPLMPSGLLGLNEIAASLLFGMVFIGLGALLGRPTFDVLRYTLGYRLTLVILGGACCALAVLGVLTPSDAYPAAAGFDPLAVVTNPKLWMAALVFAFYAPLEAFVSVWVTTFLTTHSTEKEQALRGVHAAEGHVSTSAPGQRADAEAIDQASRWVAWFWLAFLLSRVLVGILLHVSATDSWQPLFLILPALLAAVVLGNLSGSTTTRQALYGLAILGFVLGPVLPVLLAIVARVQQEAGAGQALGLALLHVGGAAGAVVLSPLVKFSAEGRTAQSALKIPLFMALLMTAAAVLFALGG